MMRSQFGKRRPAVAMMLAACLIGGPAICHVKAAETPREGRFVVESARDLPVADEVDIVVVNGNFAGIAAAVEAAQAGCRVLVLHGTSGMDYDLAGKYRLWLDADEVVPPSGLARRIFDDLPPKAGASSCPADSSGGWVNS